MEMQRLKSIVNDALSGAGISSEGSVDLRPRAARHMDPPAGLHPRVFQYLKEKYPGGLYSHQANAIASIIDGEDVCLATPTASGKSLVFMSAAADLLLNDNNASVLALYPAKALIQDQLTKWRSIMSDFGIDVGFIDGSVEREHRSLIIRECRVVLMTPDVMQAWMMSNLSKPEIALFVNNLKLLILDEAHSYSGVFGSNMAYLLRRLQAAANIERVISSTATIGAPDEFAEKLIGRTATVFTEDDDGSPVPAKSVILCSGKESGFDGQVSLVAQLAEAGDIKFIAFGDSRKLVETVVAASRRKRKAKLGSEEDPEEAEPEDLDETADQKMSGILPYRAGYEEEDRKRIQKALESGDLRGVVATSGLELGIDIGDINVVVLLGSPPSVSAFRQRFGRAGRKSPGVCVVLDALGRITSLRGGLEEYLERAAEESWLYLDNRYIQFSNALCAAAEMQAGVKFDPEPYRSLPVDFLRQLENEVDPKENLPEDFFALKQRALESPHYEFPVRSGIEKSFSINFKQGPIMQRLGTVTHSQMLREAYPGAIYYYMARPYRVVYVDGKRGEITAKKTAFGTTRPLTQNMVFPKYPTGTLAYYVSDNGFLAEAELQVSERVTGFTEFRGKSREPHRYEPLSSYRTKPMVRLFETTGVTWCFSEKSLNTEIIALAILEAFCELFGIHSRDLGVGLFVSNETPVAEGNCRGVCVYDATHGSLRLTQKLAENFKEVVEFAARRQAEGDDANPELAFKLSYLAELSTDLEASSTRFEAVGGRDAASEEWVHVFARSEKVLFKYGNGDLKEAFVHDYRYTPAGLMYVLGGGETMESVTIKAGEVFGVDESTRQVEYNQYTGDIRNC